MMVLIKLLISTALIIGAGVFFRLYDTVLLKPRRLRSKLKQQVISGPPPKLLFGNILEIKKSRDEAAAALPEIAGKPPVFHNPGATTLPFFDHWILKFE